MSTINQGRLRVTAALLVEALHLPPGTRIVDVQMDLHDDVIALKIAHHSIPNTPGSIVPDVRCVAQQINAHYEVIPK